MSAEEIVAAARTWIGTPYVHQASLRGAGADCLGLIRGVWREVLGSEPGPVPAYGPDWSEAHREERLWAALAEFAEKKPLEDEEPSDLVLLRMKDTAVAKHLGLQARIGDGASIIHAYSGHGVIETSLSLPWRRRIVARFAFPREFEG